MNAETLSHGRQDGPFGIKNSDSPLLSARDVADDAADRALPRGDREDRHRGALVLGLPAPEPTLSDFRQC